MIRRVDADEIRQARDREPKSHAREGGLQERMAVVSVAFQLHVLEVKGLIAQVGSFPGKGDGRGAFSLEIFVGQRATLGEFTGRRDEFIRNIGDGGHVERVGARVLIGLIELEFG